MPRETKEARVQLLGPDSLETLLREELRRRHVDGLFAAANRLAALSSLSLTAEEVDSEIRAVRAGAASSTAS